jgi:Cellulase (glycosyl hydrolase family 5)
MPRKLRFALLVVLTLLALPAAAVRAEARMPVGFYDDPSFRWSTAANQNLAKASAANTSIIHVLADWATIAPTKPKSPLNGADPAYNLSDLDSVVSSAQAYGLQVLLTIADTPPWANGGQTPNHAPTNLANLTQFAQMLATRYDGKHPGLGVVNRFSVWNEPNLQQFLTPQYSGTTIVSPAIYVKLYLAAYKGIKLGNSKALVAAGETSNRGHTQPTSEDISVAPATFAHLVAVADPKLPFTAWATHPYPSVYSLGPTQKVAYPNVSMSNLSTFGASLAQWFHRPVPIWVTEYGEQTAPAASIYGPVSYAKQAADAKKALQLAAANPYVQMFVWFIFRDSTAQTWSSGVETKTGAKKPSYSAFAQTAKGINGQSQTVSPGKAFSMTMAVPYLTYRDAPGSRIALNYTVYDGKKIVATGDPAMIIQSNGTVTFKVAFDPAKATTYSMVALFSDKNGETDRQMVALLPPVIPVTTP